MLQWTSSAEVISHASEAPTTAYDVANAITATARDRGDVATRLTMEETAHRYLSRRRS